MRGMNGMFDDAWDWAEERLGGDTMEQGRQQAEEMAMARYLERIKPVQAWAYKKGLIVGDTIAQGIEEGIPSILTDTRVIPPEPPPPTGYKRFVEKAIEPILGSFEEGIGATAAPRITARLLPYFILLPALGVAAGYLWGRRKR